MRPDFSLLEGIYLQNVLEQPSALESTLNALVVSPALDMLLARIRKNEFSRIVLTGMGSSFHVLHPLNIDLIQQGHTVIMAEASELVYYQNSLLDSKSLVIAISQSGRSAEIVRLLEVNQRCAAVLGVTNVADSLLAQQADAAIVTAAGEEFSVSCKTYVSTLLALKWFSSLLADRDGEGSKEDLAATPSAVGSYLDCWQDHVRALSALLKSVRRLFFVGRGRSLAAVGTGALIVKESDLFHAEGMTGAALRHGPFEMLDDETLVVVFSGDSTTVDLNRRLVRDIRDCQSMAEMVSEDASIAAFRLPAGPASTLPILEILPVQMITLALAALAGREPGQFERVSKVTTIE